MDFINVRDYFMVDESGITRGSQPDVISVGWRGYIVISRESILSGRVLNFHFNDTNEVVVCLGERTTISQTTINHELTKFLVGDARLRYYRLHASDGGYVLKPVTLERFAVSPKPQYPRNNKAFVGFRYNPTNKAASMAISTDVWTAIGHPDAIELQVNIDLNMVRFRPDPTGSMSKINTSSMPRVNLNQPMVGKFTDGPTRRHYVYRSTDGWWYTYPMGQTQGEHK